MSPKKFEDKFTTAKGEKRASVPLSKLETLWINTGTLCNLSCENCYIESSPKNDRLVYITADDVKPYLEEIKNDDWPTKNISFTGGEPFINPNMIEVLKLTLSYGHEVLVLTNATRILKRHHESLKQLKAEFGEKFKLRISLDHYSKEVHDQERGQGSFDQTIEQLVWLSDQGFHLSIAGRSLTDESEELALKGYQKLMDDNKIDLQLESDNRIVIFPEMIQDEEVPEITVDCWDILNKTPQMQMCSTERMVVKRKGEDRPVVLPCTLLAYDKQFELGHTLKESDQDVYLNHVFCSKFCVLGSASCSSTS